MSRITDDLDVTTEELVRALTMLPLVIVVVVGFYLGTLFLVSYFG